MSIVQAAAKVRTRSRFKVRMPEMEGAVARWYAKVRRSGSQIELYRKQARQLTDGLASGAKVLEVAPGPGYFAIELARLGRFDVTGLDISHTFVDIASQNAKEAGVSVDFRWGDVANIPFEAESFDLVVCQAAFKNFVEPVGALNEIHRILVDGGTAVIQDMTGEATHAAIAHEVSAMQLSRINTFMTTATLEMLRRRAYTSEQFERLAAQSDFGMCEVTTEGIGLEVRLKKRTSS